MTGAAAYDGPASGCTSSILIARRDGATNLAFKEVDRQVVIR